jgi:O-antigen/teichoic acid export membrane protein
MSNPQVSRPEAQELETPAITLVGAAGSISEPVQPRASKAVRWTAKAGFALTDQGLVSGSNFVVSIVLARWLSAEQYGGFALVFAVFLLLSMAYQCLLLEPMAIYGAGEYGSSLRGYLKSLLGIHGIISGAIFVVLAAAAALAYMRGNAGGLPGALAGIGIAAPCILLFWLARRACYLDARSGVAASGAVLYCVSMMCGLWVMHSIGALSPFSAFLIMGLSGLLTAVVLFLLLHNSIAGRDPAPSTRHTWGRHWGYGAWALAGAIASWIPAYIYYPLLGGFAGLGTVASLKALMNLAAPVTQLQAAFSMLLIPYATRRFRQGGEENLLRLGKLLTACGLGCAIAYWLLIAGFQHSIFRALYAGRYPEVAALIPLAAIGSIFWAGTFGFSTALRAMERPRLIFIGFGVAAAVSLIVGIPATHAFGLKGAIWGINVSDLAAFVLLVVAVQRVRRVSKSSKLVPLSGPRHHTDDHSFILDQKMTVQRLRYQLSMTSLRGPVTALRHRDIRSDDTFIASYPRAGSTWLRFLLQETLMEQPSTFPSVNRVIPQVGFHKNAHRLPNGGRIIKTHEAFRREYGRAIYLVRDPRDVLLSEYAFQRALGLTAVEMDDYIGDFIIRQVNANGSWRDHARSWLDASEQNPDIRIFRFEDLRRDTAGTLREMLSFLEVPTDHNRILSAIRNNGVKEMRAKELDTPQKTSRDGRFVREGAAGGWRKNLTPEQAQRIGLAMQSEMQRLGYPATEDALSTADVMLGAGQPLNK